MQLMF